MCGDTLMHLMLYIRVCMKVSYPEIYITLLLEIGWDWGSHISDTVQKHQYRLHGDY